MDADNAMATYDDKRAGSGKQVTVSGLALTGSDADNYTLPATEVGADIGTIEEKALTVSGQFTAKDREYNGTRSAEIDTSGLTLSGVVGGDDVELNLAGATGEFDSKGVGSRTVRLSTAGTLSGTDVRNYKLISQAPLTTTANITAKALEVTGVTVSNKVYDGTDTATLSGGTISPVHQDDVHLDATHA